MARHYRNLSILQHPQLSTMSLSTYKEMYFHWNIKVAICTDFLHIFGRSPSLWTPGVATSHSHKTIWVNSLVTWQLAHWALSVLLWIVIIFYLTGAITSQLPMKRRAQGRWLNVYWYVIQPEASHWYWQGSHCIFRWVCALRVEKRLWHIAK